MEFSAYSLRLEFSSSFVYKLTQDPFILELLAYLYSISCENVCELMRADALCVDPLSYHLKHCATAVYLAPEKFSPS